MFSTESKNKIFIGPFYIALNRLNELHPDDPEGQAKEAKIQKLAARRARRDNFLMNLNGQSAKSAL